MKHWDQVIIKMNIIIIEHYNESKKRYELLLHNFDYYDGIDFLSKKICDIYSDIIKKRFDGIYYKTIEMSDRQNRYYLEWHEDIGNYIYAGSDSYFSEMKRKISAIVKIINDI